MSDDRPTVRPEAEDPGSRLREIFVQALTRKNGEDRALYLVEACGDDHESRALVTSLLEAHAEAVGFLENMPTGFVSKGTVLVSDPLTEKPGDKIGRYKLLQQIGEGGCGVVYLAEQEEPVRRRVALKVIKLGMDTRSVIARFEAERQALAMMDHPNIAKVLDAGATEAGRPYFVMELVRGIKITEYCDQHHLPTRDRLHLFIKVCQAIQHAHQKGIIHRDIKPSNILITLHDGVAVPKVIDFGIAKATTDQRLTDKTLFTALEQFIGTPAYMSPEQAEMSGLDIDTRSDLYSLGVLLYEMLTGKTPFDAKELLASGLDQMRRTIREREPMRPSTRLSTLLEGELTTTAKHRQSEALKLIHLLRGDMDWIVMKCLEKDRARRYETANGLVMDIQRHLSNEAVLARPPSAAYRLQKLVRRNKLVFAAATAVAAALVIGLGAATVMFVRERLARNGEQQQRLKAESAQQIAETEQHRADAQARRASESEQQSRRLLYAADMSLAQQTLNLNNLGRARRLLDRHRPGFGVPASAGLGSDLSKPSTNRLKAELQTDLRGWEWRYLWQLTRSSALVTLTNRPVRGFSVSFSPDGSRLAVGWWDGRVDLWDVPGRRLVRALTNRDFPYPYHAQVAFSPLRNHLAATSEPKVISLYDLDSGQESILLRLPDQGLWDVRDLSFSQDGSKVVIYAAGSDELGDAVWVVNVSSSQIERRHPTVYSYNEFFGTARLSPDNRRLYLARSDTSNYRYSIQCLDLSTGQELWQTKPERDIAMTALDVSPDGRVLASGSGFEDPGIRVWDAATGRLLFRLDGHTGWVCSVAFTRDGRHLVSAATDQSIRFWDASTWTETKVLRGHTDEVHAVAISEPAQLIASASKDGDLMLWQEDGKRAADGYSRLPEDLGVDHVLPLDHSRVLLLPLGKPPELIDLKRLSAPRSLPEIGSSINVLGCFGTNILCHWNGTNQVLVRELRGAKFIPCGAITLDSDTRPTGFAYNTTRQLMAWTERISPASVFLASLAAPERRIELRSDLPDLAPIRFSEDGHYLAAMTAGRDSLCAWNVDTGKIVASVNGIFINDATFATGGKVLIVASDEIVFHDLAHPDRAPWRVPERHFLRSLTFSPESGMVATSTGGGVVRLFDPADGEPIEDLHGHLNAVFGIAFSADGRRLISASGGRESVKLWDVGTRQELLTLGGTGSELVAVRWTADGDVILAGPPWQAWRAPSWEEIAAAEAKAEAEIKKS